MNINPLLGGFLNQGIAINPPLEDCPPGGGPPPSQPSGGGPIPGPQVSPYPAQGSSSSPSLLSLDERSSPA